MSTWIVLGVVELLGLLGMAVLLSAYERRGMAYLHHRDGPTAYLLLGLGQPIAEGLKLLLKTQS